MPHQPGHKQQQHRPMPGTFSQAAHQPTMKQSQPPIQVLDPSFYQKQKKHKGHPEVASSDSESDSEEWDTESGESGPDRFRVRNVERGEFAHIGKPKRGRSRRLSRPRNSPHRKSHSKARSRSRSHVHNERRRRHDSGDMDPPPMGKYSPASSKDSSPRSSKQQLPPIHIHMNAPVAEKPTRANDRVRRDSFRVSSPDQRKFKFGAEAMSREGSWDRLSGTSSMNDNLSIHTSDGSVFSEPAHGRPMHRSDILEQPKLRPRNLAPRQQSFGYPHSAHMYGDVETRTRRPAFPTPNDYPQHRNAYFDDAYTPPSGVHRRNNAQTARNNPFDTARYPPPLARPGASRPEMLDPVYSQRGLRYTSDPPRHDNVQLDELRDALDRIREEERRPLHGRTRRANEYESGYAGDYMYERRY